ncbi:TerB family tellurite resistance protein [Aquimarina rhabdastrellae]
MYSKEEKLSLLSELLQFAMSDGKIKTEEYDFILAIASQLGISKIELDQISLNGKEAIPIKSESQRILQFHRLILLMNVDQETSQQEIYKIKETGLKMGLRAEAIDTVLEVMHQYPNKLIPPQELISIFTRFYN